MAEKSNKIGLHMSIASSAFNDLPNLAHEAEDAGYSSIWMAEVAGPDAFLALSAITRQTSTAQLATGVVPIQIRTPGVMAMSFLTLNELAGGRVVAGLGVSSPVIVERWHGASYRMPVTAMRECVTVMRQFFTEGRSKFEGKVFKSDFRLGFRRTQRPPLIYLAALNPPMLRLAGEIADGVLLNYSPPEAVPAMVAEVKAGAEKAGRKIEDIDIAMYIRMCVTDDVSGAASIFKRELAGYAFVDAYNAMFARYGLADEMAEVRRLWREGKREQAPEAISDASAQKLAALGPEKPAREMVARFRAASVNHPIIFPIGRNSTDEFRATMRAMVGA